jgi:hypothetical protein
MLAPLIAAPPRPVRETLSYRLAPRPQRTFHTVLDAHHLVDPDPERRTTVAIDAGPDGARFDVSHPVVGGRIDESLECDATAEGLVSRRFLRSVFDAAGERVRLEEVRFDTGVIPLPPQSYPEVVLPFLLSWQPFDGELRSLYAWINDRFVAKVQYRSGPQRTLDLPGGRRPAVEMVMQPDLNDWVNLGRVLTKLAQPLLPRYTMWFDPASPHTVLRFEGPYGPPGAPEIVLELEA